MNKSAKYTNKLKYAAKFKSIKSMMFSGMVTLDENEVTIEKMEVGGKITVTNEANEVESLPNGEYIYKENILVVEDDVIKEIRDYKVEEEMEEVEEKTETTETKVETEITEDEKDKIIEAIEDEIDNKIASAIEVAVEEVFKRVDAKFSKMEKKSSKQEFNSKKSHVSQIAQEIFANRKKK